MNFTSKRIRSTVQYLMRTINSDADPYVYHLYSFENVHIVDFDEFCEFMQHIWK